MGTYKTTRVYCDGFECAVEFDGDAPLADQVRDDAQWAGWTVSHHGKGDFCPDCTAKRSAPNAGDSTTR